MATLQPPRPQLPLGGPPRPRKRKFRPRPQFWLFVALLVGGLGYVAWQTTRPGPSLVETPTLTPERQQAILAALHPGWPGNKPVLTLEGEQVSASEGHVVGLAAADTDGDGNPEWGVAYAWLGPVVDGTRAVQPGFAVLAGGDRPALIFEGPKAGGWNGQRDGCFENVSDWSGSVEAVSLGRDGLGFLMRSSVETAVGGRMSQGTARLFTPGVGGWSQAWQGDTELRNASGEAQEDARHQEVSVEDLDGDGHAEILTSPDWYHRDLDGAGHGPQFNAALDARLVYRREGGSYRLAQIKPAGGAPALRIREQAPLLAERARGPITIDGNFADWDRDELNGLGGIRFDDPALLKYKRRERNGLEDCSGEVRLMWDTDNLYLRASVMDDHVVPGPAGKDLYKGDHVALWLDRDLQGDFFQAGRSNDDWQLGFTPGLGGRPAQAFCWVPRPGRNGLKVASQPLRDSFNGAVRGYNLEAAVPWASLGGPPPGLQGGNVAAIAPMGSAPRSYHLALAGAIGLGVVLSDSDEQQQELAYVSNPSFVWADPPSFNTLLLVAPR